MASESRSTENKDQKATPPPRPTPRNQHIQRQAARLTPEASRRNLESKFAENKCNPQAVPEMKIKRIVQGLREMLSRFTVSEEMYVELAIIVGGDYRTTGERIQAVQQKLSQWKDAGMMRLRTDC
mmetsp:Transcript_27866/g.44328  ORF Transcript_27866/g.44328 Transcript_27866/m.44328 type:complete len:125 (-) Transcript_27866:86-460(-)